MQTIISYLFSFLILATIAILPTNAIRSIQTPWYQCVKSRLTPPNYVFPIVWTTLYALLAVALAQVLQLNNTTPNKSLLLILFMINLILNPLWSISYFQYKMPYLALTILLAILGSTLAIIYYSYHTMPLWVTFLFIPYYLWLTFALILSTVSINEKCS